MELSHLLLLLRCSYKAYFLKISILINPLDKITILNRFKIMVYEILCKTFIRSIIVDEVGLTLKVILLFHVLILRFLIHVENQYVMTLSCLFFNALKSHDFIMSFLQLK